MYYNYDKIISYNALINFLIGEGGVGKTYGATKFVVNRFIKKGEEFAYVRRYKKEVQKALPTFFSAVNENNEFADHILKTEKGKFYCDGNIFGHSMELSTAQDLKGTNFSKVKTIIFDEFIIEKGQKKYYLQDEVKTFLRLLETLGRMRSIRVILLANAANLYNPYFTYFDLKLPHNNDIVLSHNNMILLQYMNNTEYRNAKKETRFGKLIEDTDYGNYAIENQFIDNNKNFVEKKTGSAKFSFAFIYNNITFGVWNDFINGKVYISTDYLQNTPYIFAVTLKDHTPNALFINSAKKYNCWKNFINNFNCGLVYYENVKIKNICTEVMKILLTK